MDVSCFLLVEGSADSDEDHDQYHHHRHHGLMKKSSCDHHCGNYDEDRKHDQLEGTNDVVIDDAESCSCDEPELDHLLFLLSHHHQAASCHDDEDDVAVIDEEEPSPPSSVNINGEENYDSKLRISREIMDRMEDSVFWETCMAVGYPSLY